MQLQDLDALKDIPGYRAILRAVLKTQIQHLVQQLSDQTEEESMILTASLSDGTLCLLGSSSGHDFLDGRDEIKSQFLRHCLQRRHSASSNDVATVSHSSDFTAVSHRSDFTARNQARPRGAIKSRASATRMRPYHICNRSHDSPPSATGSFLPSHTSTTTTDLQYTVGTPELLSSSVGTSDSKLSRNTSRGETSESNIESSNVKNQVQYSDSYSEDTSAVDQSAENSTDKTFIETQSTNAADLNIETVTGSAGINSSETDNVGVERSQSEYGLAVVKQEAAEDEDLSIVQVEPGVTGDQALYGADWSQNIATQNQYFSGNHSITSLPGSEMQDQSSPMYSSASMKTKGRHSSGDSHTATSPGVLHMLCVVAANETPSGDGPSEQRRRFTCTECHKSFTQRFHLNRHMNIHSGQRFYCTICPKSFSQKHQRKRHEMEHGLPEIILPETSM